MLTTAVENEKGNMGYTKDNRNSMLAMVAESEECNTVWMEDGDGDYFLESRYWWSVVMQMILNILGSGTASTLVLAAADS